MRNEAMLIHYIEGYLRKELSSQELAEFDKLCAENPIVLNRIAEYQKLMDSLADYGKRRQLIKKIKIASEQVALSSNHSQETALSFKIKMLWRMYRTNVAVAASVAIFAVITILIAINYFSKSTSANYSVLRREINRLKRSQTSLIKNMNDRPNDSINSGRFGGTGFLVAPNGYVATNYHVIQGADSVYIQNIAGQSFKVKQIYTDEAYDLAILQIVDQNFKSYPNLPYTLKKTPTDLGEDVFTIGFPDEKSVYGRGYLSSSTGYAGDTLAYQVSIPVNPGNSGGPLLDNHGNVIGIIAGKQMHLDGAAFAIKSEFLLKSLEAIFTDSLETKWTFSKKNTLEKLDLKDQIKKLQDYIFMVKAY